MEERENFTGSTTLYFLVGCFVGAGLGLLFAAKTGRETREDLARYAKNIRSKTDDVVNQVTDLAETVSGKVAGMFGRGVETARQVKRDVM